MRPVSDRFLRALTGSHTAAFRARIVEPGQTGVNPAGTEVSILGGDVQLDAGADIRSTLQLSIDGQALWPNDSTDLLTPYGNEAFVERGIAFGGGSVEWVSLGYFRINDVEQDDAPDGPIQVSGQDRMAGIVDAKLTSPMQFGPTQQYGDVIEQLAADAYPDVVIEWDDLDVAGDAIGRTANVEEDRYAFMRELVTSVGKIMFFDHRGVLVIKSPPGLTAPLWTVARGEAGVLISAGRSLSRDGVRNGILATGEALDSAPPVRGLAVDDNPDSPTYWGGPFGKVPGTYASPLLTTDAQCRLAAETVLRRSLGLPYNVDFQAIANPALEPEDVILIGLSGSPKQRPAAPIVGDSFSRTIVDGIGNGDSGHSWTLLGGIASEKQVNSGVLKYAHTSANTVTAILNSTAAGRIDSRQQVDVMVPAAATGTGSLVFAVTARRHDTDGSYLLRLEFNPGNTVTLKIARDSTPFGYEEIAMLVDFDTYSSGQWWRLVTEQEGDELRIRAWPRDDPDPREWQLTATDGLVRGVRSGLWFWRVAGNTNASPQWHIDNWRTWTLPQPIIGGEIHVIDSLTIPLTADSALTAKTRQQTLTTIASSS